MRTNFKLLARQDFFFFLITRFLIRSKNGRPSPNQVVKKRRRHSDLKNNFTKIDTSLRPNDVRHEFVYDFVLSNADSSKKHTTADVSSRTVKQNTTTRFRLTSETCAGLVLRFKLHIVDPFRVTATTDLPSSHCTSRPEPLDR